MGCGRKSRIFCRMTGGKAMFETILIIIYFAPSVIGALRDKENLSMIFSLNLLSGWTVIGWIISLQMARSSKLIINT